VTSARRSRSPRLPAALRRGLTLVEVIVAMTVLVTVFLGFLASFIHSRRVTEGSVMQSAATSLVYGIVEQIKGLDYTTLVPSMEADDLAPSGTPPYLRVRINQDRVVWLQTVYTPYVSPPNTTPPAAPIATPAPTATAASVGAIDNIVGPLPLSSVAGATSQALTLNLWVWVDEMPDASRDVVHVKRVTLVYTYAYNDGSRVRTVRDREVFIRTRFDL